MILLRLVQFRSKANEEFSVTKKNTIKGSAGAMDGLTAENIGAVKNKAQ